MESLKLFRIDEKYIRFLHSRDNRVQYNKNSRRPYVGIVLRVSNYKYFVPMESPKPNHKHIKGGSHIFKIDNGKLGILGFNNMIPVKSEALTEIYVKNETDVKYANLLRRQILAINKSKADIYSCASKTYYTVVNGNNTFLSGISCNFKKLEKACNEYDPNYAKKKTYKSH